MLSSVSCVTTTSVKEHMTTIDLLLLRTEHRPLFDDWRNGVLTFAEAVYVARRTEFFSGLCRIGIPHTVASFAASVYDFIFEKSALLDHQ